MSMSSPPLKNVICYLKQNRETQKERSRGCFAKRKKGVLDGRGGGSVWWDRKKLKVTFAVKRCGEGHVVQGTGYSITAIVGCHSSNAVFSLIRRQFPP